MSLRSVTAHVLGLVENARKVWGNSQSLDDLASEAEDELVTEVEGALVEAKSALRVLLRKLDERGAK